MNTPRSIVVGVSLLAIVSVAPSTARSHPWDTGVTQPTTYAAAARRIHDELTGVESSRRAGDLADVTQRAQRIVLLADQASGFALTLPGALRDSAVGAVLRASLDLRSSAGELAVVAGRADSAAVAQRVPGLMELSAVLEDHAPKQYVCPMHCQPGQLYDRPGMCPLCGMHLQQITTDRYGVQVTPAGEIRAGVPATLDFQIKDPAGFDAARLQVVHEKLLHLMIVSQDLSWFAHVHPEPNGNGHFRLTTSFPAGGRYVLFHDFTPDSVGMQVVPVELTVAGRPPRPKPLAVDDDRPKRIDGYEVRLSHTPLATTIACAMTFTLTRRGRPVTDLEPFLGAMGHLVMISQDRASYVHSHPLESEPISGSSIQFNMTFERAGIYKAWGQFQHGGKVLTVPFVVEVAPPGQARTTDLGASSTAR